MAKNHSVQNQVFLSRPGRFFCTAKRGVPPIGHAAFLWSLGAGSAVAEQGHDLLHHLPVRPGAAQLALHLVAVRSGAEGAAG